MPHYHIVLSTEEIKSLQVCLEEVTTLFDCRDDGWRDAHLEDVLTKVTIAQLQDTESTDREKAYTLDANHRPRDSEDEAPF